MRKTFTTRKLVIYGGLLLGFIMLESPLILVANQVEPMIMGVPFLFVWNLVWWAFLTVLFLVAYLTNWGSKSVSRSRRDD
ncbi:hypothetical protein [Halomonas huangheensis]|uniref:DUF3311 domain-containing protein n=1 Tax=Halomonas huangheensis TaxID=1178482 RepID=W1N916_9GAMM|nr:hypothetical protein [Halomonas huangheensis]ALM53345.1 hypothetical protein AR456_14475 [Halomonas huangheensis]ERL52008.1 hypothetical protein BJB45_12635 [Halomonas huangheensis]